VHGNIYYLNIFNEKSGHIIFFAHISMYLLHFIHQQDKIIYKTMTTHLPASQDNGAPLAFDCRMCGECCRGEGGIVVGPHDLQRLCAHMHIGAGSFIDLYGYRQNGKIKIRTGPDGYCIFFLPGTGCSVPMSWPDIRRPRPFFRGNMLDAASLAMAKEFCPGINPMIGHDAFVRAGLQYLEQHRLKASDPQHEANALIGVLP